MHVVSDMWSLATLYDWYEFHKYFTIIFLKSQKHLNLLWIYMRALIYAQWWSVSHSCQPHVDIMSTYKSLDWSTYTLTMLICPIIVFERPWKLGELCGENKWYVIDNIIVTWHERHNIIQTHSSVMWNWKYFAKCSSHWSWMWGILHTILPVPHNTAIGLNNVMDNLLTCMWP